MQRNTGSSRSCRLAEPGAHESPHHAEHLERAFEPLVIDAPTVSSLALFEQFIVERYSKVETLVATMRCRGKRSHPRNVIGDICETTESRAFSTFSRCLPFSKRSRASWSASKETFSASQGALMELSKTSETQAP